MYAIYTFTLTISSVWDSVENEGWERRAKLTQNEYNYFKTIRMKQVKDGRICVNRTEAFAVAIQIKLIGRRSQRTSLLLSMSVASSCQTH